MATIFEMSKWNIKEITKRLIEIQAAADGDCNFSHANGLEILLIAQRAAELVRLEQKLKQGYYDEAVKGWNKFHKLRIKKEQANAQYHTRTCS